MPPTPVATATLVEGGEALGGRGANARTFVLPDQAAGSTVQQLQSSRSHDDLPTAPTNDRTTAAKPATTTSQQQPGLPHRLLPDERRLKAASVSSVSSSNPADAVDDDNGEDQIELSAMTSSSSPTSALLQKKKKRRVTITLKRIYSTSDRPGRVVAVLSQPMPSPLEKFYPNKPPIPGLLPQHGSFQSTSDLSISIGTDASNPPSDHSHEPILIGQSKASQSTPEITELIKKSQQEDIIALDDHVKASPEIANQPGQPHHQQDPVIRLNQSDGVLAELRHISRVRRGLPARSKSDVLHIRQSMTLQEAEAPGEASGAEDGDVFLPTLAQQAMIRASSATNTSRNGSSTIV